MSSFALYNPIKTATCLFKNIIRSEACKFANTFNFYLFKFKLMTFHLDFQEQFNHAWRTFDVHLASSLCHGPSSNRKPKEDNSTISLTEVWSVSTHKLWPCCVWQHIQGRFNQLHNTYRLHNFSLCPAQDYPCNLRANRSLTCLLPRDYNLVPKDRAWQINWPTDGGVAVTG